MIFFLGVLGIFIFAITHIETKSNNSILSEQNLKKFKIVTTMGYMLSAIILIGIIILLFI